MDKNEKFDQITYINSYIKSNYDRINLTTPKGRREVWRAAASAEGKSLNSFINDIIEAYISSDVLETYINARGD